MIWVFFIMLLTLCRRVAVPTHVLKTFYTLYLGATRCHKGYWYTTFGVGTTFCAVFYV
jgi:hypothetical protein